MFRHQTLSVKEHRVNAINLMALHLVIVWIARFDGVSIR